MKNNNVFKSWVPDWLVKVTLMFCMLHSMVLLGLYTSNVTYAASFLDVEAEDLQYALCITYGTFLATIMIESRIFRYFPTRNYFIFIYFLAALTFIASAYTHNFILFIILRMFEGVLMALPWIPLRILLLTRFKSRNATILVFSFTYGMLLMASPFIMNIVIWLLENYDWVYMAYGSAFFQLLCIAMILITFNGNRFHKKIPLYQVDWASFVLIHAAILCGAYFFIYGEKKYWFESPYIILALSGLAITGGLFLMRQLLTKRPLFDMKVFRYANLRIGLFLFILFYVSRATLNVCHSAMGKIWNWEPMRIAHVQYLNVTGNAIGIAVAAALLAGKVSSRYIFIIGFLLMGVYHLWFTFLFVPDVSLNDIIIPYMLQGIAVGILFVPLVLFTVSSVPHELAPFSGVVGVTGRFWGTVIGFCLMQNMQVFLQQKHYARLQQFTLHESSQAQAVIEASVQNYVSKGFTIDEANKLAVQKIVNSLSGQSTLLADMEIFTVVGYSMLLVVVLLVINRHMKQTFDIFRNKLWGT